MYWPADDRSRHPVGEHVNRRFLIDAAERVAWTAVEAAAGALIAAGAFNANAGKAAVFAGLTAAAGVVKVTAAKFVGDRQSAALGPTPDQDAQRQLRAAFATAAAANARAAEVDKQVADARSRLAAADPPRDLAPQVPVTVAAVAKKKPAKKPTKKAGK